MSGFRTEQDTYQSALAALRAGHIGQAELLLKEVLETQPHNAAVLNILGLVLIHLGKFADAESYLRLAVQEQPRSDAALRNYGIALTGLNRADAALRHFTEALTINPDAAETWKGRGTALLDLQRPDEAIADLDKALRINPQYAEALFDKGKALRALHRRDEALSAFSRALSLRPDLVDAWLECGSLAAELGRHQDSLSAFNQALALGPDLADAWLGRGNTLHLLKRYDEALLAYDRALALNPDLAAVWHGRGNVAFDLNHYDEAIAAYDTAIALKPGLAEAWLGRGLACESLGRSGEASKAYTTATELRPDLAEAWIARGIAALQAGKSSDAIALIDRALALKPASAEAWCARGRILADINKTEDALAAFDKALALRPGYAACLSSKVFALDFAETGFAEQQKAQHDWWTNVGMPAAAEAPLRYANTRDPDRRIKVGYVSADFPGHSAGLAFKPVLSHHDKSRFEITCYAGVIREDPVTSEFRAIADHWRNTAQMSDDELCHRIRQDQIDILVDLSGHSKGNRLTVFARKPAPVAVTAWGHATGTGLKSIDYVLLDPICCPQGVRHLFAETVIDLPCLISIDPLPGDIRLFEPPVLRNGYVTFGVFNRVTKITAGATALWSRILDEVPRSRILMKHPALDEASVRNRITDGFAVHGISADRLAFLGTTSRAAHLWAFADVDISLDPFPQNGGVSTWESLQVGVPVVAKLGNNVPSRVAGSILTAVGLPEWVANTADEYLDIAIRFAAMPEYLKMLRARLPAMIAGSAAGDSVKYTRAVEAAYLKMWADYCSAA